MAKKTSAKPAPEPVFDWELVDSVGTAEDSTYNCSQEEAIRRFIEAGLEPDTTYILRKVVDAATIYIPKAPAPVIKAL